MEDAETFHPAEAGLLLLYIYSPTPFGTRFGAQTFECAKLILGGPVCMGKRRWQKKSHTNWACRFARSAEQEGHGRFQSGSRLPPLEPGLRAWIIAKLSASGPRGRQVFFLRGLQVAKRSSLGASSGGQNYNLFCGDSRTPPIAPLAVSLRPIRPSAHFIPRSEPRLTPNRKRSEGGVRTYIF
jgi:hypothetical protein